MPDCERTCLSVLTLAVIPIESANKMLKLQDQFCFYSGERFLFFQRAAQGGGKRGQVTHIVFGHLLVTFFLFLVPFWYYFCLRLVTFLPTPSGSPLLQHSDVFRRLSRFEIMNFGGALSFCRCAAMIERGGETIFTKGGGKFRREFPAPL